MRPLIGISASNSTNPQGLVYHVVYSAIIESVVKAGGLPVILPTGLPADVLRETYERLDGILIPGGGDVNPSVYGESPHPAVYGVNDLRDALEIQLAQWASEDDVPMLGICRGHQILNVALGDKLVQDINTQVDTAIKHSNGYGAGERTNLIHEVTVDATSQLAQAMGGVTSLSVNSMHHQAVTQVGENMRVVATAPDGMVEAAEMPGKTFIVTVQWHPEDLMDNQAASSHLFESFIAAAKSRMG